MDLQNKHILVTGGRTGFLGVNFVNRLLKEGAIVYAHSSNPFKFSKLTPSPNLHEFICDLRLPCTLPEVIEYVIHCAGTSYNSQELVAGSSAILDNINLHASFLKTLFTLPNVKKVLFLSSTIGYPKSSEPITEEFGFEGDPAGYYFGLGWINRLTEKIFEYYYKTTKTSTVIVRTSGAYGPYDKFGVRLSRAIPSLICKFSSLNCVEVLGSPFTLRDFIYVGDVVSGSLKALEYTNSFDIFNISSGISVTIKDVVECLQELFSYMGTIIYEDAPASQPVLIDVSKAKRLLGLQVTSLLEGLRKTVEWYQLNGVKTDAIF